MSDEAIRRVLMFDLSTKELEGIFGEGNTRKPYSDIRNFMEKMASRTDSIQRMYQ